MYHMICIISHSAWFMVKCIFMPKRYANLTTFDVKLPRDVGDERIKYIKEVKGVVAEKGFFSVPTPLSSLIGTCSLNKSDVTNPVHVL